MGFSHTDISEPAVKSAGELFCGSALLSYNDGDKATDTLSLQGRSGLFRNNLQDAGMSGKLNIPKF